MNIITQNFLPYGNFTSRAAAHQHTEWQPYRQHARSVIQLSSSRHVTSHHVTSHHITSRHITSRYVTSHHVTSRHITSHHVTSHHVTSRHITSRHVTSRHVTSRHVTSRHVTSSPAAHFTHCHHMRRNKRVSGLLTLWRLTILIVVVPHR